MSNPIKKAIDEFFGDTSRSPAQTRAGLEDAIAHAQLMCESLPDTDEDFEG